MPHGWCPETVVLSAGSFMMGSPHNENDAQVLEATSLFGFNECLTLRAIQDHDALPCGGSPPVCRSSLWSKCRETGKTNKDL